MRMEVLISSFAVINFLVFCVCAVSELGLRKLASKVVGDYDGRNNSMFYRRRIIGRSRIYCNAECSKDNECMSFFYDHTTKICQTHGIVFYIPTDANLSPETKYYKTVQDLCPSARGYIYNRALSLCYKPYYSARIVYSFARQACINEGADLITIDTNAKLLHMNEFIRASTFSFAFLIGAHGGVVAGDWKWVDGQSVNPSLWCPGEPNSGGGGWETAHVLLKSDGTGCMNDFSDGLACLYICELKV